MKRTTYVVLILTLCAAITFAAGQAQFTTANESSITITGTSTLHDWKMQGPTIRGTITLDELLAADLTPKTWSGMAAPVASVAIPVASIRSEHARMDKLMQEALKAKAHPEITYQLESAAIEQANGDGFTVRTRGKLTIAGSTREIEMMVNGRRTSQNTYMFSSEVPIRMTDYGIKPPTAMMGTIKTGNDVKVSFQWTVARSN